MPPAPRTYVTDIQHLLDERGHAPEGPAGEMARYLGRIIEAGSVIPAGKGRLLPLRCSNPVHRKRCGAQLGAVLLPSGTIDWECTRCRERGVMSNWAGTLFDFSQVAVPASEAERADIVGPLSEFDAVLRRCELPRMLRRLLLDASCFSEEHLFVFADYYQLTALRDAASKAADGSTGEDRRALDRFAGRVDGLATTLSEFFEPDESASELLN